MKKLKDFIYDYNDVLVALIIVIVAGIIIFWRINVVMSYATYAETGEVQQIDIDFSNINLNKEQVEDITPVDVDETTDNPPVEPVIDEPVIVDSPEEQEKVDEPVIAAHTFELEVSKKEKTTTWTACGKKLVENGILTEYKSFVARVVERKLESNLQPGTYDITSTMTLDEIIDTLIKK